MKEKLSLLSEVESIFAIGSMCDYGYVLKEYNDYDIRVVANKISDELLSAISDAIEESITVLKQTFSDLDVSYSDLIGPVKYISNSCSTSLLIHCILMTEQSLEELPCMHRVSYAKNYRQIFGRDFVKKYCSLKLSLKGIINDDEGIKYCTRYLKLRRAAFLKWKKNEKSEYDLIREEVEFSPEMAYEFSRYSINKCTYNLYCFLRQENMVDYLDELCHIERKLKPIYEYEDFNSESDYYIEKCIEYLNELFGFSVKIGGKI